jgi:REP element-mobilizing transposase RayT
MIHLAQALVAMISLCKRSACPTIHEMGHPPRIPVWLPWEQSVIYFVTICVEDRRRVLVNKQAFNAFKNAAARLHAWHILAAVLMPDHLHFIASPTNDRETKLGNWCRRYQALDATGTKGFMELAARIVRSFATQRRIAFGEMALYRRESRSRRLGETLSRLAISLRV